jgi:methionyl-tRNA formyltransferase
MTRVVVIGGIESTYHNAQLLDELGAEIVMLYTRGKDSPGWEGVDPVDESRFPFVSRVPKTVINTNINDYIDSIRRLKPDLIFSLGWQQIFKKAILSLCPVLGIHESLLPEGAGAVPIANAILHDRPVTGVTLFELDGGMDTGPIVGQLRGKLDPRVATATQLYHEAMALEKELLKTFYPLLKNRTAPKIAQDFSKRTVYGKIEWERWPEDKVRRTRVYPYA